MARRAPPTTQDPKRSCWRRQGGGGKAGACRAVPVADPEVATTATDFLISCRRPGRCPDGGYKSPTGKCRPLAVAA